MTVYHIKILGEKVIYSVLIDELINSYKELFYDNLIYYRNQKGLSQLDLSGICDCGKSTIGGIESRKHVPSFELILKIAYALEIHPADLFLRNASTAALNAKDKLRTKLLPEIEKFIEREF